MTILIYSLIKPKLALGEKVLKGRCGCTWNGSNRGQKSRILYLLASSCHDDQSFQNGGDDLGNVDVDADSDNDGDNDDDGIGEPGSGSLGGA